MGGEGSPSLVVAACVRWWVVVASQSRCWWAWCLVMGGEGGKRWETHVDVLSMGGDVERCGSRVWAKFPLTEFASILFRKVVLSWYVGHKITTYDTAFVV